MFSLKGKVAIVTGGGSGVGLMTVKRFREAGAKVVLADITDQTTLADELGCKFIQTDVSVEAQIAALFQQSVQAYGKIDICVNNAGIIVPDQMLEDAVSEDYMKIINVNFMSVLFALKHGPKHMNDGGAIINTASLGGRIGFPGYGAYGVSKASVVQLTKVAALELAARKIAVNCVCPSTIDTPMAYNEGNEVELMLKDYVWPLQRMCKPEEVAALYHFLASGECSYMTGLAIDLDGGYTAGIGIPAIEKLIEGVVL